jgi:hypothetical protein
MVVEGLSKRLLNQQGIENSARKDVVFFES